MGWIFIFFIQNEFAERYFFYIKSISISTKVLFFALIIKVSPYGIEKDLIKISK